VLAAVLVLALLLALRLPPFASGDEAALPDEPMH